MNGDTFKALEELARTVAKQYMGVDLASDPDQTAYWTFHSGPEPYSPKWRHYRRYKRMMKRGKNRKGKR